MGGTFMRLHDQGHEVHVAYQTSGNIAVTDEFVTRFIDFAVGFEDLFDMDNEKSEEILANAQKFLAAKKTNQIDTPEIRHKRFDKKMRSKSYLQICWFAGGQMAFSKSSFL